MKNRKTVVVAFLLVAVMLLGVGYAALTDTLNVKGNLGADISVAAKYFDSTLYFSDDDVSDPALAAVSYESDADGHMRDTAIIEATAFTQANQSVTVELTILNGSAEFDAKVTPSVLVKNLTVTPETDGHDPVFKVEWEWKDDSTTDAKTIAKNNGTQVLKVTITLLETPTEHHGATFVLTLNAESVG